MNEEVYLALMRAKKYYGRDTIKIEELMNYLDLHSKEIELTCNSIKALKKQLLEEQIKHHEEAIEILQKQLKEVE